MAQNTSGVGVALPSLQRGCVYLDWNATTPLFPESSAAMIPYVMHEFGNPSSGHAYGRAVSCVCVCSVLFPHLLDHACHPRSLIVGPLPHNTLCRAFAVQSRS